MLVALDISPISDAQHSVRGVGSYITSLRNEFEKEKKIHFEFVGSPEASRDADILHIPYFDPFQRTVPEVGTSKLVITIHDLIPLRFPEHFPSGIKGRVMWEVQKRKLKSVDAIITDSHASKEDIVKYAKVPQEKVHVVYLAADERFRPVSYPKSYILNLKSKYKLPEQFVLYVGDATWNKNLPALIQAAEDTEIPLILVGKAIKSKNIDRTNKWNEDLGKVQDMLQKAKHTQAIGYVEDEDLIALYNAATLLALPSRYEGFGLPVLEAMQCGTPVLTTKEGSLPEVGGDAAFYINSLSKDDIAEGLEELFYDTNLQEELSKKGLAQAEKFSWKSTASQTLEVYEQVLGVRD